MMRSEKGVSAVEFALIAPLLFVLTFGIVEFGLLLFDKAVVTNASREGARAAIVYSTDGTEYTPLDDAEIRAVVKGYANGYLVNLGLPGGKNLVDEDIDILPSLDVRKLGGDVTVTITYNYNFLVVPNLTRLIGGTFDGTIPLEGTTRMRMEFQQ